MDLQLYVSVACSPKGLQQPQCHSSWAKMWQEKVRVERESSFHLLHLKYFPFIHFIKANDYILLEPSQGFWRGPCKREALKFMLQHFATSLTSSLIFTPSLTLNLIMENGPLLKFYFSIIGIQNMLFYMNTP